ncbi:MAG: alpha/beta fold hydrolase [Candidatus Latescibacteria bacterium]|nr:alpha/beta fold hydrolase [Candidatus Latescibacterota bacterium]
MRLFHCILVFVLLLFCSTVAAADNNFALVPVGGEAYEMIVQSYSYDKEIPLNAKVVETTNMDNCKREKIVFDGVRDGRVPGYLAIPKTGKPPYPCIILLHGHTGNKDEWWQDDSFYGGGLVTKAFLPEGYAVLALDAQYHGERKANNEFESPNMLHKRGWYARSIEMIIQSVTEYRRAVDYLETRPEIDSSRIGVHGYSMGGMMAYLLTAVEPRVKVTVSCVTWNWNIDNPKYNLIAPQNFAQGVGNRPFLMMMGRKDPILPFEAAERLYKLIEKPNTRFLSYDSGHRLPDEYITESLLWFKSHL